jgi:hypothetical protein
MIEALLASARAKHDAAFTADCARGFDLEPLAVLLLAR